jgi:hypothetical protein
MSGWYYRKTGVLSESTEGPLSDAEFLKLATDGKLTLETLITHQGHTKGQWVKTNQVPAAKARVEKGHADRRNAKERQRKTARDQKQQVGVERQQEAAQRNADIVQQAAERTANSPVAQFLLDGQSEGTVQKILERVSSILTSQESVEYIAVQAKPVQVAPDCIVCTNRRLIIFRQKILGQMEFTDDRWLELHDAHIKEGMMFAEISITNLQGKQIRIDYLPKNQARRVYRIAQEREEEMIELRRKRSMEETQAGASNIVVNAPAAPIAQAPATDDPMAKLTKLKQMLDAGLIEQEEYDSNKQRILSQM